MARTSIAFLLFGLAAVLAFPQPGKEVSPVALQAPEQRWPSIPWPPINWFPEEAPSWWPENWEWPPPHPEWIPTEHPDWIQHPEWIPWPPANWFPEEAPSWWPENWEWPPPHPEWIPWPPQHPEWIPWPPQHPEWIPWPPQHPEWIPWPPQHPEWIPWPPQHPEWIPWPPANWFPEEKPEWWPGNWAWPPTHPEWIQHPDWLPTKLPYIPSRDNQFHLFTRANPTTSQVLVYKNANLLSSSNYDSTRRTVVLVHDLGGSVTSQFNAILVPALLAAGDVNVIAVDWSGGARAQNFLLTIYSALSGQFIADFMTWVSETSKADLDNFHLIGVGFSAWNAGFIGRLLDSKVGYVTALDPSRGPALSAILPPLNPRVAKYSEVIHTDAGATGYSQPLGDVDFYPNGGRDMPGCAGNSVCNRQRAVYYLAESIQTGGFTGTKCESYRDALEGTCQGSDTLKMGGLEPKTGSSGVFYLRTNAEPPFSQG